MLRSGILEGWLLVQEVLSEESLEEWEQSQDPEEQKGKGVALKSCTQFFKWLKEADEEGEEEDKVFSFFIVAAPE